MHKDTNGDITLHVSRLSLCHAEQYITRDGEHTVESAIKDIERYGPQCWAEEAAKIGPGYHSEDKWTLMLQVWKMQAKAALENGKVASVLA